MILLLKLSDLRGGGGCNSSKSQLPVISPTTNCILRNSCHCFLKCNEVFMSPTSCTPHPTSSNEQRRARSRNRQALNEAFINLDFAAFLLNFEVHNFPAHCTVLSRPLEGPCFRLSEQPAPEGEAVQRAGRGGARCSRLSQPLPVFSAPAPPPNFMVVRNKLKHLGTHTCNLQTMAASLTSRFVSWTSAFWSALCCDHGETADHSPHLCHSKQSLIAGCRSVGKAMRNQAQSGGVSCQLQP